MYFAPITGMSKIDSRPTNVRQPLKSLNRVAVSDTVTPSLIIHTVSVFRKMIRHTLLQMDDVFILFRKGYIRTNFKNKLRKAQHSCLRTLTWSMQHAKSSSLLHKSLFAPRTFQELGSLFTWYIAYPIVLGFEIYIVKILDRVKEVG